MIGQQLTQQASFPSAPNTTQDGRVIVASFCNHVSENLDSVQVSVVEAPTVEEARREFQYELEMIDTNGQAQDLAGFKNAKIIDGTDVLLLRDKRILRVNVLRQGNQSNPLDVKYVTSLLKIAAGRI